MFSLYCCSWASSASVSVVLILCSASSVLSGRGWECDSLHQQRSAWTCLPLSSFFVFGSCASSLGLVASSIVSHLMPDSVLTPLPSPMAVSSAPVDMQCATVCTRWKPLAATYGTVWCRYAWRGGYSLFFSGRWFDRNTRIHTASLVGACPPLSPPLSLSLTIPRPCVTHTSVSTVSSCASPHLLTSECLGLCP